MPLEVQHLNCPNCGGALDINNPGRSKIAVCPWCNSQIDLTQPPYQSMGLVGRRPDPIGTPFKLGMKGIIGFVNYQVIGRIRYIDTGEEYASVSGLDDEDADEGSDEWDEWLLLSEEGAYRWISDSDDVGLVLWEPFTPTAPVDPDTIRRGVSLNLEDAASARVRSRGSATIEFLEGEMTWRAMLGDRMNYAEAVNRSRLYSVEWTPEEVEFYRGERLDRGSIESAFGIESQERELVGAGAGGGGGGGKRRTGCFSSSTLIIIGVVVVILLCMVVSTSSGGVSGFMSGISSGSVGRSTGGSSSSGGGGK